MFGRKKIIWPFHVRKQIDDIKLYHIMKKEKAHLFGVRSLVSKKHHRMDIHWMPATCSALCQVSLPSRDARAQSNNRQVVRQWQVTAAQRAKYNNRKATVTTWFVHQFQEASPEPFLIKYDLSLLVSFSVSNFWRMPNHDLLYNLIAGDASRQNNASDVVRW